eukprot:9245458-Pyramimonas_sp.AAC.1
MRGAPAIAAGALTSALEQRPSLPGRGAGHLRRQLLGGRCRIECYNYPAISLRFAWRSWHDALARSVRAKCDYAG